MNNRQASGTLSLNGWMLLSIFCISVVLVGLQLSLMRALAVTRYYHFSYLVISTALLGFGASGTLLSLVFHRIQLRLSYWVQICYATFIVAVPGGYLVAQQLPIDPQYLLFSWQQIVLLFVYNLIIFFPFFVGAFILGALITHFRAQVSLVYGTDLLGSGFGALAALGMMWIFPPVDLPVKLTLIVILGMIALTLSHQIYFQKEYLPQTTFFLILAIAALFATFQYEGSLKIDQYKALANMQRLERQGDANQMLQQYGPRARIDVYQSPHLHSTLFAGLQTEKTPPAQLAILIDGQTVGTVFQTNKLAETAIITQTPQSIPYRLIDNPKVLLLGEIGGSNVWLSEHFNAEEVTVVQPNPAIISVMQNDLRAKNGAVFQHRNVRIVHQSPRLFLEQTSEKFDLIQIISTEGFASASGGMQSLHEDYLLTVEGFETALTRLTSRGLLSVTRSIQTPPRDNLKIMATGIESLRRLGDIHPANHLLVGRNYLAVNTIFSRSPFTHERLSQYSTACKQLLMDRDYFPGISQDSLRKFNRVEGPLNAGYSYYFHAAQQLLSETPKELFNKWPYQIRPPTDNQPYFYNFFRWSSVTRFIEVYGQHWLQRLELGYVVLVITLIQISVAAFLLILMPLIVRRSVFSRSQEVGPTVMHFTGIGFGFMLLEMVFIQRFTRFMGDPIYSVAAALTAILVFAGIGSITSRRISSNPAHRIRVASAGLALFLIFYLAYLPQLLNSFVGFHTAIRFLITVGYLATPAFFMGWFFPSGLELLGKRNPQLIPWAWGLNGFTSVVAAPLAILLAIEFGYTVVILIAAGLYCVVMINSYFWREA